MLVIGLVGGVASGKSFVAMCFEQLGARVLNADEIGHEVLNLPEVISEIQATWPGVLMRQGKIDRSSLAKIVFDSSESADRAQQLNKLEQITHPRIATRIKQQLAKYQAENVIAAVLDAPVMFKAGWQNMCDRIVFVETDLPTRLRRAAKRGWDDDELLKRESFQNSLEEKRQKSTDIVNNSGTQDETFSQVRKLWQSWNLESNH